MTTSSSDARRCRVCEARLHADSRFCSRCGTPVALPTTPASFPPAPPLPDDAASDSGVEDTADQIAALGPESIAPSEPAEPTVTPTPVAPTWTSNWSSTPGSPVPLPQPSVTPAPPPPPPPPTPSAPPYPEVPPTPQSDSETTGALAQMTAERDARDQAPYPPLAMVGAAVATVVAPFISLLFALVLRSNTTQSDKRAQLKTWAIASGAVLGIGAVIFLLVALSFVSGGSDDTGTCKGGVDRTQPPEFVGGGKTWQRIQPCLDGGAKTVEVPRSKVPGSGR